MWRNRINQNTDSVSDMGASKLTAVSSVATVDANKTLKDYTFSVGPGYMRKKTIKFLGVEGKEDVSKKNIASILVVAFFTVSTCSDVFSNVIYLLQSDDYYGLTSEEQLKVNSHASQISVAPTCVMLILSGFIFDIFGRRITIGLLLSLLTLSAILMPISSPSIAAFTFARALTQTCQIPLLSNPLINDYATVESRTKGVGLQQFGQILGQVFAFGVLFNITKSFKPGYAYYLVALWCICGMVCCLFLISEPKINSSKEDKRVKKMSLWVKIKSLMYLSCKCIASDSALIIGYPGVAIGYMTTIIIQLFYQQWLSKFIVSPECPDCPIASEAASKQLYTDQGLIGNIGALVLIVITSKLGDKVSFKILIPGTYLFRAFIMSLYLLCKDPSSWFGYVLVLFLNGTGSCELVAVIGFISQRFPKQLRGMMMAIGGLSAQVGIMIYTFLGDYLLNHKSNPSWVFTGVAFFDFGYFLIVVIAILCGKFNVEDVDRDQVPKALRGHQNQDNMKIDYSPNAGPLLDIDNNIDVVVADEEDFEDGDVQPLRANLDSRSVKFNDATEIKDKSQAYNLNTSDQSMTGSLLIKKKSILKGSTNNTDILKKKDIREEVKQQSSSTKTYPSQNNIKLDISNQTQAQVVKEGAEAESPKFGAKNNQESDIP